MVYLRSAFWLAFLIFRVGKLFCSLGLVHWLTVLVSDVAGTFHVQTAVVPCLHSRSCTFSAKQDKRQENIQLLLLMSLKQQIKGHFRKSTTKIRGTLIRKKKQNQK